MPDKLKIEHTNRVTELASSTHPKQRRKDKSCKHREEHHNRVYEVKAEYKHWSARSQCHGMSVGNTFSFFFVALSQSSRNVFSPYPPRVPFQSTCIRSGTHAIKNSSSKTISNHKTPLFMNQVGASFFAFCSWFPGQQMLGQLQRHCSFLLPIPFRKGFQHQVYYSMNAA